MDEQKDRDDVLTRGLRDVLVKQMAHDLPPTLRGCVVRTGDGTLAALLRRVRKVARTRVWGEDVALTSEQIKKVEAAHALLEEATRDHHDDCECELCQARIGTHTDPGEPEFYVVPNVRMKEVSDGSSGAAATCGNEEIAT